MQMTLAEIAAIVDGKVVGDGSILITGVNGIEEAQTGDLTFVANPKYFHFVQKTKASAILVPRDMDVAGISVIKTDNPSIAFAQIVEKVSKSQVLCFQGIHSQAILGKNVSLGKNVTVGPYAVIEDGVSVGDHTVIYGGGYLGARAKIGNNCVIHPHVMIYPDTEIGSKVVIHSGAVIGSDGFGYEQVGDVHQKIPQMGIVLIEDDVEIGANSCIDRARFHQTIIGKGTKIDNLVQIAHNVIVGENCIIISQVGISGSVHIGKNTIFAGQAGVAGHLTIGERSVVAAKAGVIKSFPPRSSLFGYPARPLDEAKIIHAHLQRLPGYVERIKELETKILEIEASKFYKKWKPQIKLKIK